MLTLCNASGADPARLARRVADIYLELRPAPATVAFGSDAALFAGKYVDAQRHFLASFTLEDRNLMLDGSRLQRVEANKFEDPVVGGIVTFSSSNGPTRATVIYNNTVTFAGTRMDDLRLDEAALSDYTGAYTSAELDTSYKLSIEDESLMLRMNWNPPIGFAQEILGGHRPPLQIGSATVGALYERPRSVFCAKPLRSNCSPWLRTNLPMAM